MKKNKVLLAFSGGLDTTFCLFYLQKKLNLEVHTVVVDTGGFSKKEIDNIAQLSKLCGAMSHKYIDIKETFFDRCIRYLIYGNILRNQTYPLSVSAERIFQSMAVADYAKKLRVHSIAHGSTGAGNDQVRFDVAFSVLCPSMEVIAPIRSLGLSRQQEVNYIKKQGISLNWKKAKYSINKGIWGTSIGGAETHTSHKNLPEEAFPSKCIKKRKQQISLDFERGIPTSINGKKQKPVTIIEQLNALGTDYAIGRDIHVGDTIIGIKGRVGFEAPAAMMLIKSHHLLEKHTLTKWQQYWKDQIGNFYGMLLHEAQYAEPAMRDMEKFMKSTQERVSGRVLLQLQPYRFETLGISSPFDLLQTKRGQYGETNNSWTSQDAEGFIKIFSNHLKNYYEK